MTAFDVVLIAGGAFIVGILIAGMIATWARNIVRTIKNDR